MRQPIESLGEALRAAYPELEAIRAQARADEPVYLVGGAVRDLLMGRGRTDLDLVVEGDAAALAERLASALAEGSRPELVRHRRFGTAKLRRRGHEIDFAAARSESYSRPGALPEVAVPATIAEDLDRRDFSINAMAIPLAGELRLIDPHGGCEDLEAGLLRVLHAGSFRDDPTRAVRAARYAARFDFAPAPETEELLRQCDLNSVSADRRDGELLRLAGEPRAARGFALLAGWGLVELRADGAVIAGRVVELLAAPPWQGLVPRDGAVRAAALGPPGGETELCGRSPQRPSEGVALAGRYKPIELVLARALGAEWLDRYIGEWRAVALEINGEDLIAAGVPRGPAVGRGLRAALARKLDGEIHGREQELEAALAAAGAG